MESKTINELKLEITNLKTKRVQISNRLCENISAETVEHLMLSKKEIDAEINHIELLISQKNETAQKVLNRSLNQSKL
jgi:hypothetical protein